MVYKTCLICHGWVIFNDNLEIDLQATRKNEPPDGFEIKWDEFQPYLVFEDVGENMNLQEISEVVIHHNTREAKDWLGQVRGYNKYSFIDNMVGSPRFICIKRYD